MTARELVRYRGLVYDSARWQGFALRPGDIVISTPPKCGTTWTQMICAMLVLQEPVLPQPLSIISPWLDMQSRARRDVVADLEAQQHRRFIKTHTPLDGLPLDPTVTYICVARDPRDVALSMDNHTDNLDVGAFMDARAVAAAIDGIELESMPPPPSRSADRRERFWQWVDNDTPPPVSGSSLLRTLSHLKTFLEAPTDIDVILLHFDDLRSDLEGQMRGMAQRLNVTVRDSRWPELVRAATFDEMRARADQLAPNAHRGAWRDSERFFNRGTSQQWRSLLDDHDMDRYRQRVNAIGSVEVIEWAHRPPLEM